MNQISGKINSEDELFNLINKGLSPLRLILSSKRKDDRKINLSIKLCELLLQEKIDIENNVCEKLLIINYEVNQSIGILNSIRNFAARKLVANQILFGIKNNIYSDKKVVIINLISNSSPYFQNCLLKLFIELEDVIFILISENDSKIIRSLFTYSSKFYLDTSSEDIDSILQNLFADDDHHKMSYLAPILSKNTSLVQNFYSFYDNYFELMNIIKFNLTKHNDLPVLIFNFSSKIVGNDDNYYNFITLYNYFWNRLFIYFLTNNGDFIPEERELIDLFSDLEKKNFYFNHWIESRKMLKNSLDLKINKHSVINYVLGKVIT